MIHSRLLPYLDDWSMGRHDPRVSDFAWSMDDSRHVEPISKDLSEDQVGHLQLFAETNEPGYQHRWRTSVPSSLAGPPPSVTETMNEKFLEREVKRQRQGLQMNEMSSSGQLDVTVYNLRNLARQTIQHEAEPRIRSMLMNQISHIMIVVEGSSLTVNQWDNRLREQEWVLAHSDHGHHWVGARQATQNTQVKALADNCGREKQKIWYPIFEVDFCFTFSAG